MIEQIVGRKDVLPIDRQDLVEALARYRATPEYAALLKKYNFEAPTDDDLAALMPKP